MTSNHIKNNILLKRMNSVRVQGVIRKSILTVEKVRVPVDANRCMIEACTSPIVRPPNQQTYPWSFLSNVSGDGECQFS